MKAQLYTKEDPDGKEVSPSNGTDFSLEELYQLLECDIIEVVWLEDGLIMIIDEMGKFRYRNTDKFYLNETATEIYQDTYMTSDWIAGNAIICPHDQLK